MTTEQQQITDFLTALSQIELQEGFTIEIQLRLDIVGGRPDDRG